MRGFSNSDPFASMVFSESTLVLSPEEFSSLPLSSADALIGLTSGGERYQFAIALPGFRIHAIS
jgi:hypothetical protein